MIFTGGKWRCDIFQVPDGRKRFSMGREITKNPIIIVLTGLGIAHFSRKGVIFLGKSVDFCKKSRFARNGDNEGFQSSRKKLLF